MYRSGLLVFALSASLTACGGGDGGDGTGPPSGPPQITYVDAPRWDKPGFRTESVAVWSGTVVCPAS